MKLRIAAVAAAATAIWPGAAAACESGSLQETVNLMVSLGQHGDGAEIREATDSIDRLTQNCPADPHVLKTAALARATLADNVADVAARLALRKQALADFDRSAALVTPASKPRDVMLNGQEMQVGFSDAIELRRALVEAIEEDRPR